MREVGKPSIFPDKSYEKANSSLESGSITLNADMEYC